ncbi:MAG: hypothetical protein RPU14_14180, partial [Candidatus Sedimenticola sp. (ex Thyasira tokunagai)]
CSAAASFSVPILSALLDNPFIALYAHSHWLLKSHPTGWTTILTEGGYLGLEVLRMVSTFSLIFCSCLSDNSVAEDT